MSVINDEQNEPCMCALGSLIFLLEAQYIHVVVL